MSEELVKSELSEDGVLTLTMNRPERRNAFNPAAFRALAAALRSANENPRAACVLLTGAGADFSSGLDLSDIGDADEHPQPFEVMMDALCALDKPLIAAAKGCCIGFGATVLFHCDIAYLGESAKLRMPFASLGLVTEAAACYLAPLRIGHKQAAELIFTAEWFGADKAKAYGIATEVFPDAELHARAFAKATEIAQWPITSLVEMKRMMKALHADKIAEARKLEWEGMSRLAGGGENMEALMAFMDKRKPDFKQFRE